MGPIALHNSLLAVCHGLALGIFSLVADALFVYLVWLWPRRVCVMVCECELHSLLYPLVLVRAVCYFRLKAVFYGVFGALGGNFVVPMFYFGDVAPDFKD